MTAIDEAVQAERERCAKIAEHYKAGMLEMRGLFSDDPEKVEQAKFRVHCVNLNSELIARDIRAGVILSN